MAAPTFDIAREKALADYRKRLLEHKEQEARLKESELNEFHGLSFIALYYREQVNLFSKLQNHRHLLSITTIVLPN